MVAPVRPNAPKDQPPSGGCVLKPQDCQAAYQACYQPPSGGCVLKRVFNRGIDKPIPQPPSGGCVLKQEATGIKSEETVPAAFRRLCVETQWRVHTRSGNVPAAFRRLCVETYTHLFKYRQSDPAAFRRLCVETPPF